MAKKTKCVRVTVDRERCKGCGLCVAYCPKGGLVMAEELNASGVHPADFREGVKCTGCGNCTLVCPDCGIRIAVEEADGETSG